MKLRNKLHGTALALSLFLLMGTATACGSDNNSDSSEKDSTTTAAESSDETTANDASSDSETASSDGLTFVITLYPDDAPITCENSPLMVFSLPPVPFPLGSPPCAIKSSTIRWKVKPS